MPDPIRLNVNGKDHEVRVDPDTPLLYVLRNDLELSGPKFGCGLSQCGACNVILDGRVVRSCQTPLYGARDAVVITLEGLSTPEKLHPLQKAFIDEQAMQCGYCINGMIISAKALLDENPKPAEAYVRQALNGNLCRCGSHNRIIRAVMRAAKEMAP